MGLLCSDDRLSNVSSSPNLESEKGETSSSPNLIPSSSQSPSLTCNSEITNSCKMSIYRQANTNFLPPFFILEITVNYLSFVGKQQCWLN